MNIYFKLIANHCQLKGHKVYAFHSFFYEKLCTHGYIGVESWTNKASPKVYTNMSCIVLVITFTHTLGGHLDSGPTTNPSSS